MIGSLPRVPRLRTLSWLGLAGLILMGCAKMVPTTSSQYVLPFKGRLANDKPWSLMDTLKNDPVMVVFIDDEPLSRQAAPYASLIQRAVNNRMKVQFVVPAPNREADVTQKGLRPLGPEMQARAKAIGIENPVLPDYGGVIARNNNIARFPTWLVMGRDGNAAARVEGLSQEGMTKVLEGAGEVTGRPIPQIDLSALPKE